MRHTRLYRQGVLEAKDFPAAQIRSLVLYVDLVGSRPIWPAHVGCLVGPDGSRRIEKDRLDDQWMIKGHPTGNRCQGKHGRPGLTDDQGASDRKSDAKASRSRVRPEALSPRSRNAVLCSGMIALV